MSGTGMVRPPPNSQADDSSFGRWSTVLAEKTLRVPRLFRSGLR